MKIELIDGQVVRTDIVEFLHPEIIQQRIDQRTSEIKRLNDENTEDLALLQTVNDLLNK